MGNSGTHRKPEIARDPRRDLCDLICLLASGLADVAAVGSLRAPEASWTDHAAAVGVVTPPPFRMVSCRLVTPRSLSSLLSTYY